MKTNISKLPRSNFNFYWSEAQTFDHHGVGLIISTDLNKHVIHIERLENHTILVDFSFKRKLKL